MLYVVDAVNDVFRLSYPSSHDEQRAIADDFRQYSGADFGICVGAIDGLLIWIGKPTPADCEEMRYDSGKFFVGERISLDSTVKLLQIDMVGYLIYLLRFLGQL